MNIKMHRLVSVMRWKKDGHKVTNNIQTGIHENDKQCEPRHEKTCSCHMRTTKGQISLRIRAV